MFIGFLCEEIVCFNEKCVVKQLAMETTFIFRVSVGLGEEPGPRGSSRSPSWSAQHHHPNPPWDRGRGRRRGQAEAAPGERRELRAASTAPQEKCHGGKSSLNPAWHSLRSSGAPSPSQPRPAARVGRARLAVARAPAVAQPSPLCFPGARSPAAGRRRGRGGGCLAPEGCCGLLGQPQAPRSAGAQGARFNLGESLTFLDSHLDVVCGLNITYDRCSSHCFQLNLAC